MRRAAAAAVLVLVLAGCGSGTPRHAAPPPPAPRLPHTLAQTWAQQADAVATALSAGDACTAQTVTAILRVEIVQAVNERRILPALQEQLLGAVNDLSGRIVCVPASDNGKSKGKHGKHGGGGGD